MKKKRKETETQSIEALKEMAKTLGEEIFKLKNELSFSHRLEQPHLLREKKRERARALTKITKLQREGAGDAGK